MLLSDVIVGVSKRIAELDALGAPYIVGECYGRLMWHASDLGVAISNDDGPEIENQAVNVAAHAVRLLMALDGDTDGDEPRCPKCGYTEWDCIDHGDHHLCDGPGPVGDPDGDVDDGEEEPPDEVIARLGGQLNRVTVELGEQKAIVTDMCNDVRRLREERDALRTFNAMGMKEEVGIDLRRLREERDGFREAAAKANEELTAIAEALEHSTGKTLDDGIVREVRRLIELLKVEKALREERRVAVVALREFREKVLELANEADV